MVIQPFVENAVIHGIVGKQGKGHVAVVFSKKDSEIVATVRDNGIGRAAAAAKSNLRDPHKPLATAITQERLQLLRKNAVPPAVEINDVYDENSVAAGTEVVVRLPMEGIKVS
jgi:sensor histidine kinase YesM